MSKLVLREERKTWSPVATIVIRMKKLRTSSDKMTPRIKLRKRKRFITTR